MKKYLYRAAFLSLFVPFQGQAYEVAGLIPSDQKIVFQILRDGEPFGMHTITFDREGENIVADINIEMDFSLGPLTLFEYSHNNQEVWKGDTPIKIQSVTDDDGDLYNVSARWSDVAAQVETQDTRFEAPKNSYPTSYWNPVYLKAETLVNTQKGQLEDIDVKSLGAEDITVGGDVIEVNRYNVDSTVPIQTLHDTRTGQWVGLEFEVRGSQISYKRLNPVR